MEEFEQAQLAGNSPESIRNRFRFHDCGVTGHTTGKQVVLKLDTQGGFTHFNRLSLMRLTKSLDKTSILQAATGFMMYCIARMASKVHILFLGKGMPELIIRARTLS